MDIITLLVYGILGGTYLLVLPALIYFYLDRRWYGASSIERLLMYFMVFWCFPGILLLAPLINLRPKPQQIS
ncbi:MAG: NAD(P)H-quinone oxidoreductase subunit L [Roseofilum sp. Belize BBD 4]|uniref:NAD(P)H-quinone oxidoreductase subunit L n=1 Tax=Roseofilum sp. Belize BBD 4 TaxID=2821500 RepID=UPI001B2F6F38|nr:NAD(P)H-quinone oxidoreductase subunit L [Roseofilum sp. Belize BBD 4]MBP0036073.1 NAD(P)H-quinone oxidoreductase subunit L [Roseofilum sp. Belize BBD 4]